VTVAVIGAGSWGTALAIHLVRQGVPTRLWAREPEVVRGILEHRRNPWFLSDVDIPSGLEATGDTAHAADGADFVVMAVPSEFVAATTKRLDAPKPGVAIMSATKGFDPASHARMSEVLAERFPDTPVAVLSGPTFAREVALGRPTAAVVAARDARLARTLQQRLGSREFRLYTNADMIGVEAGGALKNVIAIATGISDGLGLGDNARAALVTRGLAEITRLAVALGGAAATLAGLAGMGDLVLTCVGGLSRNRSLGIALAQGKTVAEVEAASRMVAEGVRTVTSALALAERHRVSMPICAEVGAVLFEAKPPAEALATLLGRAATREDA
jgi:glycerol-3-phosphate dehydrogenase (NAD(P)+)